MRGEDTTIRAERRREIEHAATRVLATADALQPAARQILEGICEALDWEVGALWTLDDDGETLRLLDAWERGGRRVAPFLEQCRELTFAKGVGLPGRVWESGEPAWIEDVLVDGNFPRAAAATEAGLHGAFGFPIFIGSTFFGVIEFFSQEVRAPDDELLDMLSTIGSQIGAFVERTKLSQQLRFQTALLRSQTEASIDGILLVSLEQRVLYWNRRLVQMWDIPESVLHEGDPFEVNERMAQKTADPAVFESIAKAIRANPALRRRDQLELVDGRVFDRWAAPLLSENGAPLGRTVYYRDITEQKLLEERLRANERWSGFLAEVSSILSETLDYRASLKRLAALAVPILGDWCAIHILEPDGTFDQVALAHTDPDKLKIAEQLHERYPVDPSIEVGLTGVIKSRSPLLVEELTDDVLGSAARDDEHLDVLRGLGIRSAMIVPLLCRDRVLGALTLLSAESGRIYAKEDLALAEDLASRAAYPIDNARLYEESANVARTLQESLLPPHLPQIPGLDLAARYWSVGEGIDVGGDFYDVFRTGRRTWGIALGDVMGKGVQAATVTALARHTIRAAAMTTNRPSEILWMLNTALVENAEVDRFCTALYASVEPRFGRVRITVSCAGHPLPYVIRSSGEVEQVDCRGTLLGFAGELTMTDATIELNFGDKLFLYTDGILDIRQNGGTFGSEGLEDLLAQCSKRGTHGAAEFIGSTVLDLVGERQRDDIAFLVVGVRSSIFRVAPRRQRPL